MFLESLESRRLLAGNVTAVFDAATNTFVIKGDNQSNDILFAPGSDQAYTITGRHGTTVNGHASVDLPGAGGTKTLVVDMGNGDDVVEMAGYSFTRASIVTGNGNDSVSTNGEIFSKGLDIDTGNGNDTVKLVGTLIADGDLNIKTGNGDDSVALGRDNSDFPVSVDGNTKIDGGRGDDVLTNLAILYTAGTRTILGFESIS
jgi:hypothetical protein